MDTKKLRQKILDLAIRGKLVPQDPNDEPTSVLLERIRTEKERLIKEGKIKRSKKSASDTPHYENEAPFEVPKSWEWTTIGKLCSFLSRGKSPKYSEERKYPVFAQKCNLYDGDISLEKARFLDPETIIKWSDEYKLIDGDILVNSTGTGTVGRTRLFHSDVLGDYPFVVPDSHVSVVRTFEEIESKFVLAFLSSDYGQTYIEDNLAGSTNQKELYIGILDNMLFPLPPQEEQLRIVTAIDKWFSLINVLESAKGDLQISIAQAKSKILDLAIHGKLVPQDPNDEPAIELLSRINPRFTPYDNAHCPYDIPGNWYWSRLIDLCSFLSRGKSPTYSEERKYPVFAQKCNLYGGGISLDQARFLDPNTLSKWPEEYKLRDGDVLVNSTGTGTVGRTRLFHSECLGNYPFVVPDSHVSVVRTVESIDSDYIYSIVSSKYGQEYLEDNLAGSTNQKELYIGVLENMLIPLPPYDEQRRIANKIEELFAILDTVQDSIEA